MTQNHSLGRGRKYRLAHIGLSIIDPAVATWANQCVWNGATAAPSVATQIAVSNYYRGLVYTGLLPKMGYVNCLVPDTNCSQTPLINQADQSNLMTLFSTSPTVSSNGIVWSAGANTAGLMSLSLNVMLGSLTGTSVGTGCGMTLYGYNINNVASSYDFGYTNDAGTVMFAAKLNDSGTTKFFVHDATNGTVSAAFPGNGYFSANVVASNDFRLYWANSTHSHAQVGSTNTTIGSIGGSGLFPSGYNNLDLGAVYDATQPNQMFGSGAKNTYSFLAVHEGLTASQSASHFALIQALRTALGGGAV